MRRIKGNGRLRVALLRTIMTGQGVIATISTQIRADIKFKYCFGGDFHAKCAIEWAKLRGIFNLK